MSHFLPAKQTPTAKEQQQRQVPLLASTIAVGMIILYSFYYRLVFIYIRELYIALRDT